MKTLTELCDIALNLVLDILEAAIAVVLWCVDLVAVEADKTHQGGNK